MKQLEIKVFWQDVKFPEENKIDFSACARRRNNVCIDLTAPEDFPLIKIPDNFDLYILHLGDLEGDDFHGLKKRNLCRVIGIDNGGKYPLNITSIDYVQFLDNLYHIRTEFTLDEFCEQVQQTKQLIEQGRI